MFKKIYHYFEQEAEKYPNAIAIVNDTQHLTYQQLNQLSNQFARYLLDKGIVSGQFVPILAKKSTETLVALLGVLKAGAAYVPMNLDFPNETIVNILNTLKISFVCLDSSLSFKLKDFPSTQIILENLSEKISEYDQGNLATLDSETAYAIYTSGTTGQPKGVEITHKNLVAVYSSWEKIYELQRTDIHLQMANFSFDVFTGDWIRALSSGARLVLCPSSILLNPKRLCELIQKEEVTVAEFTPPVLRHLLTYCKREGRTLAQFRLLICGSDSWTMEEYRSAKSLAGTETRVINSYGSTETTIDSSYYEESNNDYLPNHTIAPIGKPFPHAYFLVLNENEQEAKLEERGELYIGGPGVGTGYIGQPLLTNERFKEFSQGRFYKTGDLVRIRQDGNFDFIGRETLLTKINGKRVELASVETALLEHPGISFAMVSADTQGKKTVLNAFIKLSHPLLAYEDIAIFLKNKLPAYAVPRRFYVINQIKYNNNGKVDRMAIEKLKNLPLTPVSFPRNIIMETV
ncbi:MAG: amino acid adenylation domain protein [Gammaproteobacteria bacterium]|jgi:amino acid adenylation domain-containing protein|nr:amino acid adenylation domain protein [Gammaproteobacteria bacterium]